MEVLSKLLVKLLYSNKTMTNYRIIKFLFREDIYYFDELKKRSL